MAWFAAVLIIECSVEGAEELIFDKQIKLVQAGSAEEAHERAIDLGTEEEQSYQNSSGQVVSWRFVGLNDLVELLFDEPHDGAEIYSSLGSGSAVGLAVPKEQLTAFWSPANLDKKASELLASGVKPFAPK